MSAAEQHRTHALKLGLQQTSRGIRTGRLKRIGADELCQVIGMVSRGAHLGRISHSFTANPRSASWIAHSEPARPPPITVT